MGLPDVVFVYRIISPGIVNDGLDVNLTAHLGYPDISILSEFFQDRGITGEIQACCDLTHHIQEDRIVKLFGKICCMIPILLSALGAVFVELFKVVFIVIPTDSSFHFGLMTVNALFGGFLYSNYGMLVGLLDNDTIQKVKGTSIMARRNAQVLAGIVYATLSVVCGLYITLVGIGASGTYEWLFCWMVNGEVVFMIAAMVFYLLSLIEMNRLVKALYNTGERLGKRRISEMKKRIMNVGKKENEE